MKPDAYIIGSGWVTPLGRPVRDVCKKIRDGILPGTLGVVEIGGNSWPVYRVEESDVADTTSFGRLRRSGNISKFALMAAMDAVAAAGLTPQDTKSLPILFATSDGGVNYTRRFFEGLVARGSGAGSPLLFPETVYNAPASHIAAFFGSDAEATAIVGDSCAGLSALTAGCALLDNFPHILVVAANENDAISAAGYSHWKFLKQNSEDSNGHFFSEGAAAVVLSRSGPGPKILWCAEGRGFFDPKEAGDSLSSLIQSQGSKTEIWLPSSQQTPLEHAESGAVKIKSAINIKHSLGESLAASALMQIVAAAHWCEGAETLVTVLGFGGSVAAAIVQ